MVKIIDYFEKKIFTTSFWKDHYFLNYRGPYVHIISITRKCNNNCIYCASNSSPSLNENMSIETAKKIIDFIFSIPLNYYHIEFQGGEPLLNFDTLKFIVNYAKEKSSKHKKNVHFSLTTNLLLLDKEKLNFILTNSITVCSSFDPPFFVHHLTRGGTKKEYENLKEKIKLLGKYSKKGIIEEPNLITTITRQSLPYYKEIIDEYIEIGVNRVQLGMLEPIGRAKKIWDEISYTSQQYIEFYRKALNYIYYLNIKKNIPVYEKGFFLLISEILTSQKNKSRNLDILLRLAYDIKGNIYSSDEIRMIGENGDEKVSLGNVQNNNFKDILFSQKTINTIHSILFPQSIKCHYCQYNIICNLSTPYNYLNPNNNIFKLRCEIFKKIFSIIEKDLNNSLIKKIFLRWINLYG